MAFDPGQHLTKVKGQDYLETKWRIAWFRDTHPEGLITTELLPGPDGVALFRATVSKGTDGAFATGHGACGFDQFAYPYEKAETKAIGRALAALGFGIQFVGDDFADEAGGMEVRRAPQQQRQVAPPVQQAMNQNQGGRRMAEEQVQQQYQQERVANYDQPPHDEPPRQQVPVGFGGPPTSGANAASTAQVGLINRLLRQKVVPQEHDKAIAAFNDGDVDVNNIDKSGASRLIDHLKTLPDL